MKTRLFDIGEARIEIARIEAGAPDHAASPAMQVSAPLWRRALPWTIAAIGIVVAGVAWLGRAATSEGGATTTAPSGPTRLQIALQPNVELTIGVGAPFCLTPDGRTLAFTGVRDGVPQAFIRRFDSDDVTPVRGSENAISCEFSPDGREILVGVSDLSLRRIRLADGFMTVAARNTDDVRGAWLSDGRIVCAAAGKAVRERYHAAGGAPAADAAD